MILRKLQDSDYKHMKEWMNNEDISSNFRTNFKDMSEFEVRAFIKNSFTDENKNFAIVDDTNEYMGTISLKNINSTDKNGEYAIVLRQKAIGLGLAVIATKELLDIAFFSLGLKKIYLNVYSQNVRAIKFYEKVGFKCEGVFRKHVYFNNEFNDLMWFSILKEEYKANEI